MVAVSLAVDASVVKFDTRVKCAGHRVRSNSVPTSIPLSIAAMTYRRGDPLPVVMFQYVAIRRRDAESSRTVPP